MVAIVDYGMGNLGSIINMIKKVGYESLVTSDVKKLKDATKLILPGVGSFDAGMRSLNELGLIEALNQKVLVDRVPVLGICLGMQLMTKSSEEGNLDGLGWLDAKTIKFASDAMKVPHMGWNIVKHRKKSNLFDELESVKRFYFVHSYYVSCDDDDDVLTATSYVHNFVSSFERGGVVGVQFHPEKSHRFGMMLIKNFLEKY